MRPLAASDANPAARRSFPRRQHGQGDRAQRREGHDCVGAVRILPIPAQLLPIVRNHRPIVGRHIGRVGPDEEDDEREGDAKKGEQRESERRAATAQQQRQRQIGDQRADQDDAERAPAAVDILHDEILLRHQVDLVGEREQMRAARYQRKGGERERKELSDFKGHDRNSAEPLPARQCVRPHGVAPVAMPCSRAARPIARLFAPTAAADKLISKRLIKRRSFRPPSGASEEKHHRGGMAMTEATSHHYIPALGNIYRAVDEYAEPVLRIALGAILIPHGMQKLFGAFGGMGFAGNAALFDRIGFTPGIFWGTLVGCTELIGGTLLVLGLFTRFAAAAVVIFMIMGVKFTSAKGFFWTQGGSEYALLIGFCALFFLVRDGGAWSLDRAIGREL